MSKWLFPTLIGICNALAFAVVVPLIGANTFVNVFSYVVLGGITVLLYHFVKYENFLYILVSLPVSLILGFLLKPVSLNFNPNYSYAISFLISIIISTVIEIAIADGCDQLFNNKNRAYVSGTPWKKNK